VFSKRISAFAMPVKEHVEILNLRAGAEFDHLSIHKMLGCGENLCLTEQQFNAPTLQKHPMLLGDFERPVIAQGTPPEQNRGHVSGRPRAGPGSASPPLR
jgi:hypothetical protein